MFIFFAALGLFWAGNSCPCKQTQNNPLAAILLSLPIIVISFLSVVLKQK
jgi:hypothetical protein